MMEQTKDNTWKNRTWNKKTTFVTLWASSHSDIEREKNDYYATDPKAIIPLLKYIRKEDKIREPCCWEWHLSKELVKNWYNVISSDLIDRWYWTWWIDFLKLNKPFFWNIVTNPPYKYAMEFVENSLELIPDWKIVCMFLKLTFLESIKRKKLFDRWQLRDVLVFSKRIQAAINWDLEMFKKSSAACYAWFIWEKWFIWKPTIDRI